MSVRTAAGPDGPVQARLSPRLGARKGRRGCLPSRHRRFVDGHEAYQGGDRLLRQEGRQDSRVALLHGCHRPKHPGGQRQELALLKRSLTKRSWKSWTRMPPTASAADKGKPIADQVGSEMPISRDSLQRRGPDHQRELDSAGEMSVPTPQKGQTVLFGLTNTSKEKIGVVVRINGESTLEQEVAEDAACLKWILCGRAERAPSRLYTQVDSNLTVFRVLDDQGSAARMAEWSGSRPRAASSMLRFSGKISGWPRRDQGGFEAPWVAGRNRRNINRRAPRKNEIRCWLNSSPRKAGV